MSNDNLVPETNDSPSEVDDNVNPNPDNFELDMSIDALASHLESQGEDISHLVEESVDEEPEEDSEEQVEPSDESNIEAETPEVEEEESDQEEPFAGDIDVISITELAEQVGKIEINGKEYSPAQLKSMLGQEESAGTKVREAATKLKEAEAKVEELNRKEALLNERTKAAVNVDEMAVIQSEYKQLATGLEKARGEGDAYEITIITDKMNQLAGKYRQAEAQVSQVRQQEDAEMQRKAVEGLKSRGLEYLVKDTPQAKAWTTYAQAKLSETELRTAALSPAFAEVIEKARKWEEANGKEGKKLVNKAKSAPKRSVKKSRPDNSLATKMKNGTATREEIEQAIFNQGREMFNS